MNSLVAYIAGSRFRRELHDPPAIRQRGGVARHEDRVSALGNCGIERPHDFFGLSHIKKLGFETQQGSCRLELFPLRWDNRVPHICEERHSSDAGNRLSHQLEPFCDQFGGQGAQAGDISARACESGDDAGLDRFAARGHDHGNRPGGILGRHHRLRPAGHDQIDI